MRARASLGVHACMCARVETRVCVRLCVLARVDVRVGTRVWEGEWRALSPPRR